MATKKKGNLTKVDAKSPELSNDNKIQVVLDTSGLTCGDLLMMGDFMDGSTNEYSGLELLRMFNRIVKGGIKDIKFDDLEELSEAVGRALKLVGDPGTGTKN